MDDNGRVGAIEWYTYSEKCKHFNNTQIEDHNGDIIIICMHPDRLYSSDCNKKDCPLTLEEFRNII